MSAQRFPPPPPSHPPMSMPMQMPMMSMMPQMMMAPSPPIFKAHIVNKLKKVGDRMDSEIIQEVKLNNVVVLEGLHIVPNGINLPEMGMVGKTKPDLRDSFQLQIYGRKVDTLEIVLLANITVCGGIQWMPTTDVGEIDYMAFGGNFEELSIVLHGKVIRKIADSSLQPLPYPSYLDELLLPYGELIPTVSLSQSFENQFHELFNKSNNTTRPSITFHKLCENLVHILYDPVQPKELTDVLSYRISTMQGQSLVPIKEIADLVGKIFSLQKQNLKQLDIAIITEKMQEITDITTILQHSLDVSLI